MKRQLRQRLRNLRVVQLKGNLFFGNAGQLTLHFREVIDDLVARRSRRLAEVIADDLETSISEKSISPPQVYADHFNNDWSVYEGVIPVLVMYV